MKYVPITAVVLGFLLVTPGLPVKAAKSASSPTADQKGLGWHEGKMKAALGLSDEQVAKLKALHQSEKESMKPLKEKEHSLIETLEGQVKNKALDVDIQTTLSDIAANHNALISAIEKNRNEKATILTPTQQAKMLLWHRKMFRHRHGNHEADEDSQH